jgi:uncharacterized protein (TIGR02118 family)
LFQLAVSTGATEKEVSMVRVTVLYPNEAGKRFDHAYYASKHLPLVMERLKDSGMLRYEVDKGLAGGGPGAPAPFVAACHLYFNAAAILQCCCRFPGGGIGAHGTEIMGDIPNYTDISPQIQISEIVVG